MENLLDKYNARDLDIDKYLVDMTKEPIDLNESDLGENADKDIKYYVNESNDVVMQKNGYDYYVIEHDRLEEDDWISHMLTKAWVNMKKFLVVYFEACQREGIKKLNIVTRN